MSLNLQLDEDSNDEQFASHEESFSESNNNSRFNSVVEPDLSSDIEQEEDFVPEKSPHSRALPDWMTIPSHTKKRKREDVETETSPKKRKITPSPTKEKKVRVVSPKKSPKKSKSKTKRCEPREVGCPEKLIKREKHYIGSEDNISPSKQRRLAGYYSSDEETNEQQIKVRGPSQRKSKGTRVIYDLLPDSLGSSGDFVRRRSRSALLESFEDDSIEDQDFDSRAPSQQSESSEEIQESPIENSSSSDNNDDEADRQNQEREIVFKDQNSSDNQASEEEAANDIDFTRFLNFRSSSSGKIEDKSEIKSRALQLQFNSQESAEEVAETDESTPNDNDKTDVKKNKAKESKVVRPKKTPTKEEPDQPKEQNIIVVQDIKKIDKLFTHTPTNISKAELEKFVSKYTATQLRQVYAMNHNEKLPAGAKKYDLVTLIVSSVMRRVMNKRKYYSTDQMIQDYVQKRNKQEKMENKKKAIADLKKKKQKQKEIKWLRAQYKRQKAERDLHHSVAAATSPHVRAKIRFEDEQK
jgi:hypothetical protein